MLRILERIIHPRTWAERESERSERAYQDSLQRFVPINRVPILPEPMCEAFWNCDCGCGQTIRCHGIARTAVRIPIPDGDAFRYERRCDDHA